MSTPNNTPTIPVHRRPTPAAQLFATLFQGCAYGYVTLHKFAERNTQTTITVDDLAALDKFVAEHRNAHCYYRAHPMIEPPAPGSRGNESATAYVTCLVGDFDWQSAKHPSAPPEVEVRNKLESFPHRPSIIVETGNGVQVGWLLDEPVAPEVGKQLTLRIEQALQLRNDRTDLASILRLPGTYNDDHLVRLAHCEAGLKHSARDLDETLPPLERSVTIDDHTKATPAEVARFLDRYTDHRHPRALDALIDTTMPKLLERWQGRHQAARIALFLGIPEAIAGAYPARLLRDRVEQQLADWVTPSDQRRPRNEIDDMIGWQLPLIGNLSEQQLRTIDHKLVRLFGASAGDHAGDDAGDTSRQRGRPSAASELVTIAEQQWRFVQADDGRPFAVPLDGSNIARPLDGTRSSLRTELAATYHAEHNKVASRAALTDALAVLEGIAATSPRETLHLRTADLGDRIIIDLGTPHPEFVIIDPTGWHITDHAPCLFRRTELTSALPTPTSGGDLDDLADLINTSGADLDQLVAWIVATLFDVPRPILFLSGEQGTGKSLAARTIAQLIDPTPAPLRAGPRDLDAWIVAAAGSQIVALDNLSRIGEWLSDALCRAATGEGLVRRALYTDDQLSVISFRRSVILTSIDAGALRGDLGERLVPVELEPIDPTRRKTDTELAARFAELHPGLLGAVLNLAAETLATRPLINLVESPRMADYARILASIDKISSTNTLDHYLHQAANVAADIVGADPVAAAIVRFLDDQQGQWIGTPTELHESLKQHRGDEKDWPKTARALSGVLTRLAPALRMVGVEMTRRRSERTRRLELRRTMTQMTQNHPRPSVDIEKNREKGHSNYDDNALPTAFPASVASSNVTPTPAPPTRRRTLDEL